MIDLFRDWVVEAGEEGNNGGQGERGEDRREIDDRERRFGTKNNCAESWND